MKTYSTEIITSLGNIRLLVYENSLDALNLNLWIFYIPMDKGIVLDTYNEYARKTLRSKHKLLKSWNRLEKRNNTIPMPTEIPNEIKSMVGVALREFIEELDFILPEDKLE